jgi:hypothetical protein
MGYKRKKSVLVKENRSGKVNAGLETRKRWISPTENARWKRQRGVGDAEKRGGSDGIMGVNVARVLGEIIGWSRDRVGEKCKCGAKLKVVGSRKR